MIDECALWLEEGLQKFGRSRVEHEYKKWMRSRLPPGRPKQQQFRWPEYKRLYEAQGGVCPLCQEVMPLIRGKIEMDHINCQLTGEAYNARSNRQVVCKGCNREKSATTVPMLAKTSGRTMTDIVRPGYIAEPDTTLEQDAP